MRLLSNFFRMIGLLIGALFLVVLFCRLSMWWAPVNPNGATACFVAGRSGGHMIPAITMAREYHAQHPNAAILFFTAATPLDFSIMQKNPWIFSHVPLALENVPRGFSLKWLGYAWDVIRLSTKIFVELYQKNPASVTTTGGYIAVPVTLIAWTLGVPVYLHELNVVPGSAAKFISRFSAKTIICFDEARDKFPRSAAIERGDYPIRFSEKDKMTRDEACKKLGLDLPKNTKILLVIGGSQGSRFINDLIPYAVTKWPRRLFILHQTGAGEVERVKELYKKAEVNARVFAFSDDMPALYQAADLVITRAGAGSLFELLFFNKRAIIIPLETLTTDHQLDNARAMARKYWQLFFVYRQSERRPEDMTSWLWKSF